MNVLKFYEHQTVTPNIDFPEKNIKSGDVGVVVAVFTSPNEAYEVEFVNDDGSTKAMFAILPEHLEEA